MRAASIGFELDSQNNVFVRQKQPETVELLFLEPELRHGTASISPIIAFDNIVFRQMLDVAPTHIKQKIPRIATAHLGVLAGLNQTTWYIDQQSAINPVIDEVFSYISEIGQCFLRAWPDSISVAHLLLENTGISEFRPNAVLLFRFPELIEAAKRVLKH